MIQPGDLVAGCYRVDACLGQGGMAVIYKVWDQRRQVYLALKLLRPEIARSPELIRQFESEARALERLEHDAIVRFYEIDQSDGDLFLLMDYVDGQTLREALKRCGGALEIDRVREVLRPICAALTYAHRQGIVHRDIKPENILINQSGKTFLSDFGIARVAEIAASGPAGDDLFSGGTPAYMAPEQIRAGQASPQTDIYALGVVLYEMLSGKRPFTGDRAPQGASPRERLKWEHLNLFPTPLSQVNPRIPVELEWVVNRCLSKDPDGRYASGLDLFNAFESALERVGRKPAIPRNEVTPQTQTIVPRPSALVPAPAPLPARSKMWLPVLAVVAVSILVGLAVLAFGGAAGKPLPATLPPPGNGEQSYPYTDACIVVPVPDRLHTELHECVQSIGVQPDGKLKVTMKWLLIGVTDKMGMTIKADTNNRNMYLVDDLGNRLDHVTTGGAADQDKIMYNGDQYQGWFLFPAPAPNAHYFYFRDDDNHALTPKLERLWP